MSKNKASKQCRESRISGLVAYEYFGIINLLTGFEPYGKNGQLTSKQLLDYMGDIYKLGYDDYHYWVDRINQVSLIKKSELIAETNIMTAIGMSGYLKILEALRESIRRVWDSVARGIEDDKSLLIDSLYWCTLVLRQILELKKQYHIQPIAYLEKLEKMQHGKNAIKSARDALTSQISNVDQAVTYIESNYASWQKIYRLNAKIKQENYPLIPKHFRNWFKRLDENNLKTKQRGISQYWKEHTKTTQNGYIKELIYKNK